MGRCHHAYFSVTPTDHGLAGHVLLRCEDKVCLYDLQQMKSVAEVTSATCLRCPNEE